MVFSKQPVCNLFLKKRGRKLETSFNSVENHWTYRHEGTIQRLQCGDQGQLLPSKSPVPRVTEGSGCGLTAIFIFFFFAVVSHPKNHRWQAEEGSERSPGRRQALNGLLAFAISSAGRRGPTVWTSSFDPRCFLAPPKLFFHPPGFAK